MSEQLKKCRELLIVLSKQPFMIALDLDYTIWPTYCYEETKHPYIKHEEDPKGLTVRCTHRATRQERMLSLFPDVLDIISLCKEHNITLTICSKSPKPSAGQGILEALGVWDVFWNPQIYSRRKTVHMNSLVEASRKQLKHKHILFYDDDYTNIIECSQIGVTCQHLDSRKGLNWEKFHQGLILHRSKLSQSLLYRFIPPLSSSENVTSENLETLENDE